MSFPKELPAKIINAGTPVAQIRLKRQGKKSIVFVNDRILYLSMGADGTFVCFVADDNDTEDDKSRYVSNYGSYESCKGAVQAINSDIVYWEKQASLNIVEWETLDETAVGREFSELFLDGHPERKDLDYTISFLTSETAPAPRRPILSRSEWMARHYPQPVAAA